MDEEVAEEALKILIEKWLGKRDTLNEQINSLIREKKKVEEKLLTFNESYQQLSGESLVNFSENQSIAELAEGLLRDHGELTADVMVALLADQGHIVKKQSLVATLVRYSARDKRFRRAAGRNRFGLLETKKED